MNDNTTHEDKIQRGNQIAARETGRHIAYGEQHMTTQKTKAVSENETTKNVPMWKAVLILVAATLSAAVMCVFTYVIFYGG